MQASGLLYVFVHRAEDLPAADIKLIKKSSSDPYCVLRYGKHKDRTKTIPEQLNPKWDHLSIFRLGSRIGRWIPGGARQVQPLEIEVYDEDQWSSDDLLGTTTIDLASLPLKPGTRLDHNVNLHVPTGVKKKGVPRISLSFYWVRSPPSSIYTQQVLGFLSFFAAGAMCIIAANCRWEPSNVSEGSMKQPGVFSSLVLAALSLFGAGAVHLVLAHTYIGSMADLLEYLELGPLEPLVKDSQVTTMMTARTRTNKFMGLEVVVDRAVDLSFMQIPTLLIGWLLPAGGFGLIALSVMLQAFQVWGAHILAGQILAGSAALAVLIGYWYLMTAEAQRDNATFDPVRTLKAPALTRSDQQEFKRSGDSSRKLF